MEDVAKIPYLIGKGPDQKFKRNVPKELRGFTDVLSAWVERPRDRSAAELKRQGNMFAVRTDAAIKMAKRKRDNLSVQPAIAPNLALDDQSAKELAIMYFHDVDKEFARGGAYQVDRDDPQYEQLLLDASEAGIVANRAANGIERRTDQKVLAFLVEKGLLPDIEAESRNGNRSIPKDLAENPAFTLLCRYVERADQELTRKVFHSVDTGRLPPIADSIFLREANPSEIIQKLNGKTIGDLKEALLSSKKEQRLTVSRLSQYQIAFRVLEEFLGVHCVLSTITKPQCREIVAFLPRISAFGILRVLPHEAPRGPLHIGEAQSIYLAYVGRLRAKSSCQVGSFQTASAAPKIATSVWHLTSR